MRWFLRLFSAFRELESTVVNERQYAADALALAARLEEKLDAKNKEHEDTMRRMVDSYAFAATGRRVFAAASDSPIAYPAPHTITPGKRFARDFVQERTQKFMAERASAGVAAQEPDRSLDDLMAEAEKAG